MSTPRPLSDLVAADWADALAPVAGRIEELGQWLRAEVAAGRPYLPAGPAVLRAFTAPRADVRVLVVGQDPYPTPGHPIGLSFAVERSVRPLPRSLANIYRELHDDLGVVPAEHGDLSAWQGQGVLLLNRVLTVRAGASGSHRGRGWEEVPIVASAHPSPLSAHTGFFGSRPFSRVNELLDSQGSPGIDWRLPT